ncbi:MAG TPA: DUF3857 and transglutaminase domain-containing protein [Terriglobia bacterium]|nr:DUF3857 and transglutaminase domain-containing protein [Terriglobia bacterium]
MKKRWFCKPRRKLRANRHLAAALALALASLVAAGEAAWGSTPAWVRSAADVPLPKYPDDTKAVLLLHEQATTVGANGDVTTRYRRVYRILRPEGRSFGIVTVEYDNETRLNYLRAWCIAPGGKDYEAKEKDALESSLSLDSLYVDVRRKVLSIPGSEPGSVVAYEYEQRQRPTVPQDVWWFQDEVPVRQARYALVLPPSWEYHNSWINSTPRKPEQTGSNAWTWEVSDVPPVEEESDMPAWEALAGRMGVTYFAPGAAPGESHASWKEIGAWYSRLASAQRQDTPAIRQSVADLTAGQTEIWGKVQALARFVQSNIRYVAIEIGAGGYQPHAAQVTFANRYGDCKDKATLLAAMLGVIGVKSWYVLVNSRRSVVNPDFPTMLGFDHVILAIQIPDTQQPRLWAREDHKQLGPILYFDPTDPYVPLNYLPESLQDSYGLLVTDDGGELLKLPLLPASLNRLILSAKMTLQADGNVSGDVLELFWGAPAIELRTQLLSVPEASRQALLEKFLSSSSGAFALEGARVEGLDKIEDNLTVSYHFTASNYAKSAGDLLLLRPHLRGTAYALDTPEKERKNPVEFPTTLGESETVEIHLPDGYQVDELPPPTKVDNGLLSYMSGVEADGGVVQYKQLYQIKQVLVPTTKLSDLRQFYQQVNSDEQASIVLKHRVVDHPR